ncbi:hypothetical protein BU24DRAFT_405210 [Aaosphaeria arxii CBS 175.79]|uniref:Uncharacterized protein n=1 Tax=Aaosphaeria arxii CBS 175.79 TaxID=1450172 RepID=A0A6A5YCN2_9PLEO|nr:uncharacterized protein BU24DRAFT_405210 [Aaosphaeria arxii CBS 175.79]KAF2022341.1 hypothetical protein BU24DRAFT_405210 [Aaosphaeria arxii CBS 175.79]
MKFSLLQTIACLLAIEPLACVLAFPAEYNPTSANHNEVGSLATGENEKRAGSNAVPMKKVASNTWAGSKSAKGLFGQPASDAGVRGAAKDTADQFKKDHKKPGFKVILATISIPGVGFVSGTQWKANDEDFEERASTYAPNFWAAVPGGAQQRNYGTDGAKWHAEAVAAARAEELYGAIMDPETGRWPDGTKIYVYEYKEGSTPKPFKICEGESTAMIGCTTWLRNLNIDVVPMA